MQLQKGEVQKLLVIQHEDYTISRFIFVKKT